MLVSNSTLESLASRFVVGRGALDELSQASFSLISPPEAKASAAALTSDSGSGASQGSAQNSSAYEESFARMMLGLKTQAEATLSETTADRDNGVSSDVQTTAANDTTYTSTQQQFLDYMKQPAEDRLREQLTGVGKEEYEAMSAEEKHGVDEKFKDALKQQQEVAQQDINVRINALKAGLIG